MAESEEKKEEKKPPEPAQPPDEQPQQTRQMWGPEDISAISTTITGLIVANARLSAQNMELFRLYTEAKVAPKAKPKRRRKKKSVQNSSTN